MLDSFRKIVYDIQVMKSRCVGIGRRDGLKIRYQQWCVGSSPTIGTIFFYKVTIKIKTMKFFLVVFTGRFHCLFRFYQFLLFISDISQKLNNIFSIS